MNSPNGREPCALIVDDEPDILELLELTLSRMGVASVPAGNLSEARRQLENLHFDLCLTDMRLPDGDGMALIDHIQQHYPTTPVAMITAHGNMDSAIRALKAGAFDFLNKPVELQALRDLVSTALRLSPVPQKEEPSTGTQEPLLTLLGNSKAMATIRRTIAKVARSQAPVYISGESGTGKELVARLIHSQGPRADAPFVPVNCGAIPADLMESELFGYKKGSFTGANHDKEGLFQAANGGTLFLDEVADLPLSMQVKLLRAIQEKAIRPVGAQAEEHIDVRILSATHKDLKQLLEAGNFRQDLFYRLNVIELTVPPLRERPEDIPDLVEHILERIAREQQIKRPQTDGDTLPALQAYRYPGNIRELENILERAVTLCEEEVIRSEDLKLPQSDAREMGDSGERPGEEAEAIGLENYLEGLEREAIIAALEKSPNKTEAARRLGLTFRSFRYRLKKFGLE